MGKFIRTFKICFELHELDSQAAPCFVENYAEDYGEYYNILCEEMFDHG